jgi:two-component system OmpR family response regulator
VVVFALQKHEYETIEASNGLEALDLFEKEKPDLLVLDIMMPELDGTELCKEIRKKSATPIIFASAMNEEVDMLIGLEVGGDDYLFKPFSTRELVARVKAVLRRSKLTQELENSKQEEAEGESFNLGQLSIDSEKFKVFWQENEIVLTVTEISLLQVLASKPGKVFSREALMQNAYDNIYVSDRTIDSHIRRLRAKFKAIGAEPIETVHGAGYKLGSCE